MGLTTFSQQCPVLEFIALIRITSKAEQSSKMAVEMVDKSGQ